MKTIIMKGARALIILSCFILDVRVRAADHEVSKWFSYQKTSGFVDVDEWKSSVDVETFKDAKTQGQVGSSKWAVNPHTFLTLKADVITVHRGVVFLDLSENNILVKSKNLDLSPLDSAQIVIEVLDGKTTVSVLKGRVKISDRLTQNLDQVHLKAGHRLWIGGLKSNGEKAIGRIEPIDLEFCISQFKLFGNVQESDLNVALDHLRVHWKSAVDEVAKKDSEEVLQSMKLYGAWKAENKKREIASIKEKTELKKRFRAHALDLPDQSE